MTTESKSIRLADQLRRMVEGGAWHGPSLAEAIDGMTAADAAARPVAGAHSVWEIVLHLDTWADIVRRRLPGVVVEAMPEQDWPPVPETTEAAWVATRRQLDDRLGALHAAILGLTDDRLSQTAPGRTTTVYALVHGAIQHLAYHIGQIVLLRRSGKPV